MPEADELRVEVRSFLHTLASVDAEAVGKVEAYIDFLEERLRMMVTDDPFRAMFIDVAGRQAELDVRVIGPQMEIKLAQEQRALLEAQNAAKELAVRSEEVDLKKETIKSQGQWILVAVSSGGAVSVLITGLFKLFAG